MPKKKITIELDAEKLELFRVLTFCQNNGVDVLSIKVGHLKKNKKPDKKTYQMVEEFDGKY